MRLIFNFILGCILTVLSLKAEAQSTFLKTYGTSQSEYGTSLCNTKENGFVVASILPLNVDEIRTVLFCTDRNGDELWAKSYGLRQKNVPAKVIPSGDGGYFLLFSTWLNFNPSDFSTVLVKTDSAGNEIWSREFSYSQSDLAIDVESDGDHLYVVCTADYNIGYPSVLVHKLDTAGTWIWSHRYNANYQMSPVSATLDGNGRLGICGTTNSYGIGTPINDNNFLLIIDSTGQQFSTTITGVFYSDEPHALVWHKGNWIMTSLGYDLPTEYDISMQRFDSSGTFIESNLYDATTDPQAWEVARDIIPLEDGSIVMVGDVGKFEERNIFLAKINPDATMNWAVQYPISPIFTNYAFQLVPSGENGYAFTGDLRPPTTYRNAYIIKTDSVGVIPCYVVPLNFSLAPNTPDVMYVTVQDGDINSPMSIPALIIDNPSYPPTVECEHVPPVASFAFTLDSVCPESCFTFYDESINPVDSWTWTFNGGEPSAYFGVQPPPVCFPEPGDYTISLEVANSDGNSSYSRILRIHKVKCDTVFIPNVITPNGDGKNDLFSIKGLEDKFNLKVFNRWGNKVFESQNKDTFWNPVDQGAGVYYYVLRVYTGEGNEEYKGTINVISAE